MAEKLSKPPDINPRFAMGIGSAWSSLRGFHMFNRTNAKMM
ncbi:hypothetical protein BofuT4_uP034500.1 [Botrytis cinerea T4]|uniref:Uncharacterized protein n=1 Tax=Botryotinia fuckeliana (strain T4) TaxID=999810 RepID=G2Y880_BOTF4|nr:hypothetical protein BofuT4_uP034500.1 [Botrytis cinerea T4]